LKKGLSVVLLLLLLSGAGIGFYLWNTLPSKEDIIWLVKQDAGRVDVLRSVAVVDTKLRPKASTADIRLLYSFHEQMETVESSVRLEPVNGSWRITGVTVGVSSFDSLEELGKEVKFELAARDLANRAEAMGKKVKELDEQYQISESVEEELERAGENVKDWWERVKDDG
jgi:hypothetical protein